jgi:hypothetical protein
MPRWAFRPEAGAHPRRPGNVTSGQFLPYPILQPREATN